MALDGDPGELLEEEGIAARLVENHPGEVVAEWLRASGGVNNAQAVRSGQRPQRQLRRVGLVGPRRSIAGTVAGKEEDRGPGKILHQRGEELLRGCIDPVQIFDDEDEWAPSASIQAHPPEGVEGAGPDRLRGKHGKALHSFLHPEEQEKVRRVLVGVHADFLDAQAHLAGDDLRRVGVGDAAIVPDDVEDGNVRDGGAVG